MNNVKLVRAHFGGRCQDIGNAKYNVMCVLDAIAYDIYCRATRCAERHGREVSDSVVDAHAMVDMMTI